MRFISYFLYAVISLTLFGCVYTTSISKEYEIKVDFEKNNTLFSIDDLQIVNGELEIMENIYEINFLPVRGGATYFLGSINIKESNVVDYKRVKIKCGESVNEFTLKEVMTWPKDSKDDQLIYVAPKICSD